MSVSGKRLGDYPDYVWRLLQVKSAAARANAEAGVLPPDVAAAVEAGCTAAWRSFDAAQFPVDLCHGGGGIGVNMNVNEVVAAWATRVSGLDVDPVDHVNRSQSTADVCHTAIRLTLRSRLSALVAALDHALEVMAERGQSWAGVPTIARTCMMDALPVEFSQRWRAWMSGLARRRSGLGMRAEACLQVNLGGTVIGSGDGASPRYRRVVVEKLAEVTGEPVRLCGNLFDAAQNMDDLVAVSQELSNLAQMWIRICQALRFLASGPEAGVAEIRLPKTQAGSSFFPGKVNPVIPELVIQSAVWATGLAHTVEICQGLGEADLNVFEEFAGVLVMDQAALLTAATRALTEFALRGLELNEEVCRRHAESLVPTVSRFTAKYGYRAVSKCLQRAEERGLSARDALRELEGESDS
ncbi:MAG: aspartate ammonia-lyase [Alicyclobacillus sp.]|nr:aspartate ammonia-lyase [Alicyclobacillus sp.]